MRPHMKPKIKYGDQYLDTYLELEGVENDVRVHYESSPDEPENNFYGGVEIISVMLKGWDVLGLMNEAERDDLYQRVTEYENDRWDPSNWGDF